MSSPSVQTPAIDRWQRAFRALRQPAYKRYFYAQIPMVVGNWIHSIALGWLMWRLSASPFMLGVLALCDLGPTFLLGPLTGTVIDRVDRRKLLLILLGLNFCFVSLLAILSITDSVTILVMLLLTPAIGIVQAFESPARHTLVAELVPQEDLRNALALNSLLFNSARLVGPAIGGVVAAWAGEGWAFALKAVAFIAPIYVIATMKLPRPEPTSRGRFFEDMRKGLAFVRSHAEAARILILVGICSFTSVPYFSFLPVLAGDMLGADASLAGLLMSVSGIGAVAAGLTLTFNDRLESMRFWPVWSSFALGLLLIGMGLSRSVWLTCLFALPMGFAILSQNLASNTMLQHFAPPGMRGRVMAIYSMMMLGTVPIGSLVAGGLASLIGMPAVFVIGGLLCTATALGAAWHRLRHPDGLLDDGPTSNPERISAQAARSIPPAP
ncbi:MFS transporter [Pelagovum pacificum]|uniref:MFS transporter n=1 Tax=Pelagovum pacificum TaxID=2588711 RepID=A0A5C5GAE1_9RHOB|nr:MFS transporter [Pelagovum pacificum]QQA41730.1 MFS transporter [Pelagovum pacificum]TNY31005.1 MFS transporter [Pelagovum pacificum]